MTAVKWLEEQIIKEGNYKQKKMLMELFEQAKQMEKEQVELRHKDGRPMRKYNSPKLQAIEMENKQTAVEWFAKEILSYKSPTNINGTDYISIPINKVEFLEMKAKEMEKGYIEISDDEIENEAERYEKVDGVNSFKEAIKWYREQLKNK